MARYLSAEWIAELDAAAAADRNLRATTAESSLTVQQTVTAGPDGDVTFHVVADHGSVAVREGAAAEPTVTFTQTYDTAVAVALGELSGQGAFMAGRIRVSGDLPRLGQEGAAFANIEDVFRAVRGRTTY